MGPTSLTGRLSRLFALDEDIDRQGTIATIRSGVVFQGPNVWSLVLAIFVASIGLNLNSPAVIIGAMLISPLMGPITGAGLALGIYDLGLLRRSLANLALMTVISLAASTLYFWLSPLDETTSELLARTTPTFYDVLIAALGGAALMVGISQKSKSTNLLAGVAIATALMPPLCTAGFGLATRDLAVFAGAFYLYLINSVFIGLVTYLFSKALRLRTPNEGEAEGADLGKIRKRHMALTVVAVIVFVTPSVFVAYDVVTESGWRSKVAQYEKDNLVFSHAQVISTKLVGQGDNRVLEIALVGEPLSPDLKAHLDQQLQVYGLKNLSLRFVQPANSPVEPTTQSPSAESLVPQVTREVLVLFPSLANLAWGDLSSQGNLDASVRREPIAFARWLAEPPGIEKARLESFLRLRLARSDLSLVHETLVPVPGEETR